MTINISINIVDESLQFIYDIYHILLLVRFFMFSKKLHRKIEKMKGKPWKIRIPIFTCRFKIRWIDLKMLPFIFVLHGRKVFLDFFKLNFIKLTFSRWFLYKDGMAFQLSILSIYLCNLCYQSIHLYIRFIFAYKLWAI